MAASTLPAELYIVALLALFAASLWIPYIVGVNMHPQAGGDPFQRPPPLAGFPDWVQRSYRAHLNLLEQLLPFAILVLIVDSRDGFSGLTYWTAIVFLVLRLVHAVGMITGTARMPLRPIVFTGGWVCCLVMGYAALTT